MKKENNEFVEIEFGVKSIVIDFGTEEILERVMTGCKYKNIEELANKQDVSVHRINLWLEEDDIEEMIDFCNDRDLSKYVVYEKNEVELVKKKKIIDKALRNLVNYFMLKETRELRKVLNVKEETIFEWRKNNKIGELVEAVAKAKSDALPFIFANMKD